jgi:hypothetical protein
LTGAVVALAFGPLIQLSHNRTPVLIESRTRFYVGQVANLRRVVNPPADQYANAAQAD